MKRLTNVAVATSLLIGMQTAHAALAEHFNKTVSLIETDNTNQCIFFQLTGVTQANPVVPNGVWFVIDKTKENAKEMFSILLSMKLTGGSMYRVLTNGDVACGQARVLTIDL